MEIDLKDLIWIRLLYKFGTMEKMIENGIMLNVRTNFFKWIEYKKDWINFYAFSKGKHENTRWYYTYKMEID